MLELKTTNQFRKDIRRIQKRGGNLLKLETVLSKLQQEVELDKKYRDHPLKGNYQDFRECHIEPDWLLIYAIDKGHLILTATRTGSHSDLF
ncbi:MULTISPECIES: type II toxin-antitoxin system YafQ family toxin [unclassified Streptococcus]|uniref:type II toxin-antitoxin system YafQ family toxin n=1 Tax=unclassified Streptococcus TaxID=2608887 RepID=UPI001071C229|nr:MULTISPECIES: type II toxin-antitoxin system YafQ family toxin [unclassified Streptococcus]MBF0806199.1 type II toxin-antitoxin system YafQ family toxin [Streptococcus sp. 19428wA2_WM07]TFU28222.1 type II toxin-antitoxin system YafQ family toxin [Streptococcus sp. WM07]